jgi:hypothetical protein
MKKYSSLFLVAILLLASCEKPKTEIVALGKLDAFWRNQPVLGPYLQAGLWLYEVPDCFMQTDFPYKKRPYSKEVLFSDRLSTVRILGGSHSYPGVEKLHTVTRDKDNVPMNEPLTKKDRKVLKELGKYDFVYRKKNGTLGFRYEIIKQRLQPYMDNGYDDFTIVLDNMPWCLVNNPILGAYGHATPPDSFDEWYDTVRELCIALENILGEDKANKLTFRIGTEMNDHERYDGEEDRFLTHFDYTVAAIEEVLPQACLTIYNIAHVIHEDITTNHDINSYNVLKHASMAKNRKTGASNKPVPTVPTSCYFYEAENLETVAENLGRVWNYVRDSIAGYGDDSFSREIHEFSALGDWKSDPHTTNPDAFGTAMMSQVIINLRAQGLNRLFHWNLVETLPNSPDILLPSAHAWLFNVLDYMTWGESYKLIPQPDTKNNTTFRGLLSTFDDKAYLLISAFNPDRMVHENNNVTFVIPKNMFSFDVKSAHSATLNNGNSVMYQIRQDLEKSGLLIEKVLNKPGFVTRVNSMNNNQKKTEELVNRRWNYYQSLWKSSLTLKDFEGEIEQDKDNFYISLNTIAPETTVLVLE